MQTAQYLISKAAEKGSLRSWSLKLNMSEDTLIMAKRRGTMSPPVAWALAEELQEDPVKWSLLAAAETERDSACKTRMLKALKALGGNGGIRTKVKRTIKRIALALSPTDALQTL